MNRKQLLASQLALLAMLSPGAILAQEPTPAPPAAEEPATPPPAQEPATPTPAQDPAAPAAAPESPAMPETTAPNGSATMPNDSTTTQKKTHKHKHSKATDQPGHTMPDQNAPAPTPQQ